MRAQNNTHTQAQSTHTELHKMQILYEKKKFD